MADFQQTQLEKLLQSWGPAAEISYKKVDWIQSLGLAVILIRCQILCHTRFQAWPEGAWQNQLFLGFSEVDANEIFRVEMPEEPTYTDWSNRLRYQP